MVTAIHQGHTRTPRPPATMCPCGSGKPVKLYQTANGLAAAPYCDDCSRRR
ncbi:MAG: hypothetical protein GY929_11695 [Actinomycetia bacterium]|nr:hypothetical protein [Actinomycetes bacterium]